MLDITEDEGRLCVGKCGQIVRIIEKKYSVKYNVDKFESTLTIKNDSQTGQNNVECARKMIDQICSYVHSTKIQEKFPSQIGVLKLLGRS